MPRLRQREKCPIHGQYFCCGRAQKHAAKPKSLGKRGNTVRFRSPVQRIEDPHHPRGYREIRNRAAMRILLNQKIKEQRNLCALCGEPFTDYREAVPDHIEPRGFGGARRDDHEQNIQAVHVHCNAEKGSKRIA